MEANDVWAAIGLGRLYYYGNGVEQDYAKALEYFQLAENSNIDYVWLMLGHMFHIGLGVGKNLNAAKKYYLSAMEHGHVKAIACLGSVEKEIGNKWKGRLLCARAILTGFVIALRNVDDRRLSG